MSCNVAFIGLGVMGYPMAGYISKGGHNVTVFNRTKSKAEKWIKEYKGKMAETPAEAAKDAEYVFTCVGNDNDLREVTFGENGILKIMVVPNTPHVSKCDVCKSQSTWIQFLKHNKIGRNGIMPYRCEECRNKYQEMTAEEAEWKRRKDNFQCQNSWCYNETSGDYCRQCLKDLHEQYNVKF